MNMFRYQYRFLWIALSISTVFAYLWHFIVLTFGLSWWYCTIGVVCIFGFMTLHRFILQPRMNKELYDNCPWLKHYYHEGGLNVMRKFRITLEPDISGNMTLEIGYIQFGGYFFYEILKPTGSVVVFETYFGVKPCDFLFLVKDGGLIKAIELLPEDSTAVPSSIAPGHWWQ